MRPMLLFALSLLAASTAPSATATQPHFTPQDLVSMRRLSDPQASPDGHHVAFVLRVTDIEADRGRTDLWLLDLDTPQPAIKQLTRDAADDSSPRWSPDGTTLYFLSERSGRSQIWKLALAGGEATQVTDYPLDVNAFRISPRGDRLAVSMRVFSDCKDLGCSRAKFDARQKNQATGRLYDQMFVRQWDSWYDGSRAHLFIASLADGKASAPLDVSAAVDADVPSRPFGGDEEFTFSPDGARIVFAARLANREESWSTNLDLYETETDGSGQPRNLTASNRALDSQPVYLADGTLAYIAMARPGFEADRAAIMLRDARSGTRRALAPAWDRSVDHLSVSADRRTLLASADDGGQLSLFAFDPRRGIPRKLVGQGQVTAFTGAANAVVYALASLAQPEDLFVIPADGGAPRRLTGVNASLLGERSMSDFEPFSFAGWKGEPVQGYVMKPFGFRAGARFPVAFIVHGGPQSSFANGWTYRWNAQTFAARGYGVVFIDFHGSTGYGQAFTDSISRDWGGKPLEDLQKGLAAALAKYPWLDGERACALGASYGGFMINWIAGNWPDRFRCLVNHDGIFDQRMMYYSTEQLWFPEWEQGGPYYDDPAAHERFNPANFVTRWRTPMLVIHGEQDFRIPYDQGLATFAALQRRGIESRLLVYPNEDHWVSKPANSVQWYATVLDWLDAHLKDKR